MLVKKKALADYFVATRELVDAVKRDIIRDTKTSQQTILALNKVVLAANAISDLTTEMEKININLN